MENETLKLGRDQILLGNAQQNLIALEELYEESKDRLLRLKTDKKAPNAQADLLKNIQCFKDIVVHAIETIDGLNKILRLPGTFGIAVINEERVRTIKERGFTAEHDQKYVNNELIDGAISYLDSGTFEDGTNYPAHWPFSEEDWKPSPHNRIRELVKAAGFIASEIDRLKFKCENGGVDEL